MNVYYLPRKTRLETVSEASTYKRPINHNFFFNKNDDTFWKLARSARYCPLRCVLVKTDCDEPGETGDKATVTVWIRSK